MDLTYTAVKRQLSRMGCLNYEVGIGPVYDSNGQKLLKKGGDEVFLIRAWGSDVVLKSVAWLKQNNMRGSNIYIRPAGSQGLLLMDDLSITTLQTIESDGVLAACVVETSPLNYQAWIRVSDKPIDTNLATATSRVLAERYRTDLNSADWRHFGRLSGFTNRKPEHVQGSGRFPFVLLRGGSGRPLSGMMAVSLIDEGKAWLAKKEAEKVSRPIRVISALKPGIDPVRFYEGQWDLAQQHFGSSFNASKADWLIVNKMLDKGYSPDDIKHAMYEASFNLSERKRGHVDHYVNLTLDNALKSGGVNY